MWFWVGLVGLVDTVFLVGWKGGGEGWEGEERCSVRCLELGRIIGVFKIWSLNGEREK